MACLGLSRLIYSHRILFIIPALYYSCGQPNRATFRIRWQHAHVPGPERSSLSTDPPNSMPATTGSAAVRLAAFGTPGDPVRLGACYAYARWRRRRMICSRPRRPCGAAVLCSPHARAIPGRGCARLPPTDPPQMFCVELVAVVVESANPRSTWIYSMRESLYQTHAHHT